MPSKRICKDTVTLYNYIGEVNGSASFVVTILKNVMVHTGSTIIRPFTVSNDTSLCIFDANVEAVSLDGTPKTFLDWEAWGNLPNDEREKYWTLDGLKTGKDKFAVGVREAIPPKKATFNIATIQRYDRGLRGMHYWSVKGK